MDAYPWHFLNVLPAATETALPSDSVGASSLEDWEFDLGTSTKTGYSAASPSGVSVDDRRCRAVVM